MAKSIEVNGLQIKYQSIGDEDFISLTDLAKFKSDAPDRIIERWLRNRSTIDYLAVWETLYNLNFDDTNLNQLRLDSSTTTFMLSAKKWTEETNAIGIFSKIGRTGGTFAHKDIAFKFASWLSVEFELYLIKEFQRLKKAEMHQLEWNAKRELSKINYHIHTDAIKENLIIPRLTAAQIGFTYADEADMLNVILFGKTAVQWKKENPDKAGNQRDYADVQQLLVLANMETHNAAFISEGLTQEDRMKRLSGIAERELKVLMRTSTQLFLPDKSKN